jgi:hypothetical protein
VGLTARGSWKRQAPRQLTSSQLPYLTSPWRTLCRKERLRRLRRHLHEVLLDQLPLLRDLQRVLDEAALGVGPPPEAAKAGRLILEQVGCGRRARPCCNVPCSASKDQLPRPAGAHASRQLPRAAQHQPGVRQ